MTRPHHDHSRSLPSVVRLRQALPALGFALRYGGESASFTSFSAGNACLNQTTEGSEREWSWWGRVIFHVADVDQLYQQALDAGLEPQAPPRDATWGERFFHIVDPDGHELSFAKLLEEA